MNVDNDTLNKVLIPVVTFIVIIIIVLVIIFTIRLHHPIEPKNHSNLCFPKYTPHCSISRYGCCPDGKSISSDPYQISCKFKAGNNQSPQDPTPLNSNLYQYKQKVFHPICSEELESSEEIYQNIDCRHSPYGCCPNGLIPRQDFLGSNCYREDCYLSKYGCCSDKYTVKKDFDGTNCFDYKSGCDCKDTLYGCCNDNKSIKLNSSGKNCSQTSHKPKKTKSKKCIEKEKKCSKTFVNSINYKYYQCPNKYSD